jgi:aryl-alcohol dehydrogenase-like predicted oxidoreductase
MRHRILGKTGLEVSVIGFGSWQFSGAWGKDFTQDEVGALLHRASTLGINFIDTAECYGDHLSEQLIGTALKSSRQDWVIATKFGHNNHNGLDEDENYSAEQVQLQLETSLKALKTDYIDLYQLHSAKKHQFENDELWTMLDKQVQAGKVRFLGNSIGNPRQFFQVEKSLDYGISVIQTIYNALKRDAEEKLLPFCQEHNLGVIARVPLASGFLSGKYQPGHVFAENDIRSQRPADGRDRDIATALEILQDKPADMPPATWANAWCLQQPSVATVIPGIKNLEQLEENAAASDVDL